MKMDERIYQGQQKIWSEMGRIMYYLAVGSLLVKCLALRMGLGQCVVEYVITVGVPVYHLVRSWQLKISFLPAEGKRKKRVWLIRIGMLAVVGIYWFLNYWDRDWKTAVVYLVSFLTAFQITRMLMLSAEKKRAKRLEAEFDDEDCM